MIKARAGIIDIGYDEANDFTDTIFGFEGKQGICNQDIVSAGFLQRSYRIVLSINMEDYGTGIYIDKCAAA